ncbi:MAG: LysR substrate-binding domain-containing protein, partial [Betaproteobacteria bacterium]
HDVPVRGRLRSNNLSALLAAARAGFGLAILPRYVAQESLKRREIAPVLTDHTLPAQEMHAVYPSPKLVPQRVQTFVGFLAEQLQGEWWAA